MGLRIQVNTIYIYRYAFSRRSRLLVTQRAQKLKSEAPQRNVAPASTAVPVLSTAHSVLTTYPGRTRFIYFAASHGLPIMGPKAVTSTHSLDIRKYQVDLITLPPALPARKTPPSYKNELPSHTSEPSSHKDEPPSDKNEPPSHKKEPPLIKRSPPK